jgi:hypothetical protein
VMYVGTLVLLGHGVGKLIHIVALLSSKQGQDVFDFIVVYFMLYIIRLESITTTTPFSFMVAQVQSND